MLSPPARCYGRDQRVWYRLREVMSGAERCERCRGSVSVVYLAAFRLVHHKFTPTTDDAHASSYLPQVPCQAWRMSCGVPLSIHLLLGSGNRGIFPCTMESCFIRIKPPGNAIESTTFIHSRYPLRSTTLRGYVFAAEIPLAPNDQHTLHCSCRVSHAASGAICSSLTTYGFPYLVSRDFITAGLTTSKTTGATSSVTMSLFRLPFPTQPAASLVHSLSQIHNGPNTGRWPRSPH